MRLFYFLFWLCIGLGASRPCAAQAVWASDFPFAGQLPTNEMTCLHQDADGFLWVGTTAGLARFDGYRLQTFVAGDGRRAAISPGKVTCMAEDESHLWVGTTQGLNIIDKLTYECSRPEKTPVGSGHVRALCSDDEGRVWAAVANRVYAFHLSPTPADSLLLATGGEPAVVNSICPDPRGGRIWICTRGGIFVHHTASRRTVGIPPEGQPHNPARLFCDKEGRWWLATWGEGLWRMVVADEDAAEVRFEKQEATTGGRNAEGRFFSMEETEGAEGRLWVLSYDNFQAFRYDEHEAKLVAAEMPPGVDTQKTYTQVMKDRQGNLWLSSYDGGTVLTFGHETVASYPLDDVRNALEWPPNLLTLARDAAGRFWFVQDRFGLCVHDPLAGRTVFAPEDIRRITVDARVATLSPAEDGLWVAAPDSPDLCLLRLEGGRMYTARTLHPRQTAGVGERADWAWEDGEGKLWTRHGGRILCHASTSKPPTCSPDSLHFDCLARGDGETVRAVGADGQLYIIGIKGGRMVCQRQETHFVLEEEERAKFVAADTDGGIWVATDHGRILHAAREESTARDESRSFDTGGKAILNLIASEKGLWVVTHNQIVHFDTRTGTRRGFSTADAPLGATIFLDQAACLAADGTLYAGGHGGIVGLRPPATVAASAPGRRVEVTDIRQGERSLLFDLPTNPARPTPSRHSIVLPAEATHVAVSFSTLDLARPGHVRYAYRLEGVDTDWNYLPGGMNTAYYQNLPGGDYRLWVKATGADGQWQEPAAVLSLRRLPAWHETAVARTAFALTALLLLGLLLRAYTGRIAAQGKLRLQEELTRAKLDYFANISHDLLTPLSVMACVGDYWEQHYPAEKEQTDTLRHGIARLRHLLGQALDFRKAESGHLTPRPSWGDLAGFARRVATEEFVPLALRKGVDLRLHIPEGERNAKTDFDMVAKIVGNLLSNAIKYTPAGRGVDFEMDFRKEGDGRRWVVFTVRDEGPGIPKDEQQAVFERFFTGKSAQPGVSNGIGLSLAKDLAKACGGHIALESKAGEGATFTATLPAPEADGEGDSPADSTADTAAGDERPAILLVDDNEELLAMMTKVLSPNYRVRTARSGEEALKVMDGFAAETVVTDVMMPGMDGFALCRHIKGKMETSHIPVVVLTAKQGADDRVESYEAGADGFLSKPFELKVLAARITGLVRSRRERQAAFRLDDRVQLASLDYTPADTQFLQTLADCVSRHLSEERFGLDDLAGEMNMSASTLHRKVKAMTGMTPLEFVRNIKLKYACTMLARRDRTVSEIAYAIGFASPKYFTKCFKEEFNLTPSEYLRRIEQKEA